MQAIVVEKKRKRIVLSLSDQTQDELEDWADQQGRPVANLAGFLIETAIERAKESGGYIPGRSRDFSNLSQLIYGNWDILVEYGRIPTQRLTQLRDKGIMPTELEVARLSAVTGTPESQIEKMLNREKEPNGA